MNALINNRLTNSRKVLYLIFGITFLFNSLYSESDVRYYIQCPNEIIYDRVELKLDSIKTEEKLDNSYCYFSPKKGYYLGARQSDNEKIVRISAKPLVIVKIDNMEITKISPPRIEVSRIEPYNYFEVLDFSKYIKVVNDNGVEFRGKIKIEQLSKIPLEASLILDKKSGFRQVLTEFFGVQNVSEKGNAFHSDFFESINYDEIPVQFFQSIAIDDAVNSISIIPKHGMYLDKKVYNLKQDSLSRYKIPNVVYKGRIEPQKNVHSIHAIPDKWSKEKIIFQIEGKNFYIEAGTEYLKLPYHLLQQKNQFYTCLWNKQKYAVTYKANKLEIKSPNVIIFDLNSTQGINRKNSEEFLQLISEIKSTAYNSHYIPLGLYYIEPNPKTFDKYSTDRIFVSNKEQFSVLTSENIEGFLASRSNQGEETGNSDSELYFICKEFDNNIKSLPTTAIKEDVDNLDDYLLNLVEVINMHKNFKNLNLNRIYCITYDKIPNQNQIQLKNKLNHKQIYFYNFWNNNKKIRNEIIQKIR